MGADDQHVLMSEYLQGEQTQRTLQFCEIMIGYKCSVFVHFVWRHADYYLMHGTAAVIILTQYFQLITRTEGAES